MAENEEMDSQPEVQTMMIDTTDKGKNFLKQRKKQQPKELFCDEEAAAEAALLEADSEMRGEEEQAAPDNGNEGSEFDGEEMAG